MLILLHSLHLLDDGGVVFVNLVYVVLDAVHGGYDIVLSSHKAVLESELVRVASVLQEVHEASKVLAVDLVLAENDLLVVCEIRGHPLVGVASVSHLVQELLLNSLQRLGQSSEDLLGLLLGLVSRRHRVP